MIHVVLMGNILNGFRAIGPFRRYEAARKRAEVEGLGLERADVAICANVREIPDTNVYERWVLVHGGIVAGFRLEGPVSREIGERLAARRECELLELETPE